MHYFRNLRPFKVISFDLDNTLYDNADVIHLAEAAFLSKLQQCITQPNFSAVDWKLWKQHVEQQYPLLCEDVTLWRELALQALLVSLNKSEAEIALITHSCMTHFLDYRHRIDVPQQTFDVLEQLQQRYALSVISNGNVNAKRIDLTHFALCLRGGEHGRNKPHADLFQQTAQFFQVQPHEILHVGDDLITDVQGAIQAGCQSVWINLSEKSLKDFPEARTLPTLEINDLTELLAL